MRSIFISWLAVISPLLMVAQEQGTRVVNSMGLYKNLPTVTLEASIGEVAITTITNIDKSQTITQGFLQPMESNPCDNVNIEYYPNPTRDQLTVRAIGCESKIQSVEVIDIWGRSISLLRPDDLDRISLSHFSQGMYLLKVQLKSGLLRAINVVKVSEQP